MAVRSVRGTIVKAEYPALIRAVYEKHGFGSWVYADLVVVGEEIGLKLYPSLLYGLRCSGWVNPVSEDGAALRRQRQGTVHGPKLWAVSAAGAKKAGAVTGGSV